MTVTYHANNGVVPEEKYVETDVPKGVPSGVTVPSEVKSAWTVPTGWTAIGWSFHAEPESEDDKLPADPETGDEVFTPTGDTDIYVLWDKPAGEI